MLHGQTHMPPGRNEPCPCGSGRKYKQCCGKVPANATAPQRSSPEVTRAWSLLQSGQFAQAEAECDRLLRRELISGQALVCLGLARRSQGKDALAAFESASRSMPDDAQVQYLLGQALEDHGLLERAAVSFGRAVVVRPEFAEAFNDLGRVLLQLGQTDAAITSCQRALVLQPRFAAALGNLANAERTRGALGAAIAGYRGVIALEPGIAEAHRNLGSALLEHGERDEAILCLKKALELRPDLAGAVTQLAGALSAVGRAAEAVPYYDRLLARDPRVEVLDEYATLLAGLGHYEAAARWLRSALKRVPGNARLHANLGHVLHCLGEFRTAIDECRCAVELDPHLPEAHFNLGNTLLAQNALSEADASYRAGLAIAPDHAGLHTAQAMVHRALGRLAEAEASTRRALELRPNAADTLALLGSLAIDHGRFEEAEDLLRKSLAIDPELPEALTSLTAVRKMTQADGSWREAAERALARNLPVAHAINLHHALGKYHDDLSDADAAFEQHRRGNELARRSRLVYNRADMTQRVTRTIAAFDRDALAKLRPEGPASDCPVFVVGMPRSGTSLTEQILASHPQVHGAGELLYWIFAADAERAAPPERRAAMIAELGRNYLDGLAALAPEAMRVVDKLPVNFRDLGLIHLALPGARIIHIERDALDTCLSIYFQGFSASHPYATDFGDLAHYYHEYRRLMAHWREVLAPQTLFELRYEDLIDDPEGWSRRMLAHIGLPWDPRCLEFHRTERPVLTASNWQVRQPISRGSIGRWRRYERFIAPLRAALGDALPHNGERSDSAQ
jgi:tetratricopeptide (TPR) repeat protein